MDELTVISAASVAPSSTRLAKIWGSESSQSGAVPKIAYAAVE